MDSQVYFYIYTRSISSVATWRIKLTLTNKLKDSVSYTTQFLNYTHRTIESNVKYRGKVKHTKIFGNYHIYSFFQISLAALNIAKRIYSWNIIDDNDCIPNAKLLQLYPLIFLLLCFCNPFTFYAINESLKLIFQYFSCSTVFSLTYDLFWTCLDFLWKRVFLLRQTTVI